nr:unnamed protein product [Digitaria exilis]
MAGWGSSRVAACGPWGGSAAAIERELSRDGSHYSISSGILPSLGARSNRRVKLRPFIVSPYDRRYRFAASSSSLLLLLLCRIWETFLIILVAYSAWVSPFEFGFIRKPTGGLAIVDNVVNAFFAVDIILTFFVAYLDRMTYLLEDDPKRIAWRYTTSWFVLDLASTIPTEIARKILPPNLRSYGFFNMLRLWRLRRVSSLFARYVNGVERVSESNALLEKDRHFNYFWVRCAKLICVYLFEGVSNDLIFQLVSEMKAEYFPPREDVILQNEAPTDFYILVTGSAELIELQNGAEQASPLLLLEWLSQEMLLEKLGFFATALNYLQFEQNRYASFSLLKQQKDNSVMVGVLKEIENMLAGGRLDLPITLCFAVTRGDDLLLHQLLKRGLDPNESDNNGHTALVYYEGKVPLWEALCEKHAAVVELLVKSGANLSSGDTALYACVAIEENNTDLLKDIVRYGGDINRSTRDGTTPLHRAVCDGNVHMVELLLEHGADIDKQDNNGWSPRDLAEHQGHDDIQVLFKSKSRVAPSRHASNSRVAPTLIGRFNSEPSMLNMHHEDAEVRSKVVPQKLLRKRVSFQNSLFGVISSSHAHQDSGRLHSRDIAPTGGPSCPVDSLIRVTISCPETGNAARKLVHLPQSMKELLELGAKKFGFTPTKVLTIEGAEIDELELIRDGDHIVLASDEWVPDVAQIRHDKK